MRGGEGGAPGSHWQKVLPFEQRFGCTVSAAAEYVGISKSSVYELLANGEVEGKDIAGRKIVIIKSLLRLCGEAPSAKREKETARPERSASP